MVAASGVLLVAVVHSIASALSVTDLVLYIPAGHTFPSDTGYSAAALISIAVLIAGLVLSTVFGVASRRQPDGPGASQTS